jgi:hypothetical protein
VDRVVRNLELMDWLLYIKEESEFKREGFKLITNNTVAACTLLGVSLRKWIMSAWLIHK